MSRTLRDSGIEWIGKIPDSWHIGQIGQLYTERREKVSDVDYPPLSVKMKGILPQLSTAAKTDAHDDRKLVRKGDFAINSRSDRRGSCGISPYDGSVSLINTILTPRGEMHPVYYNWLFHSTMFSDEFYKWGHGIVDDLWTTGWQDMKRISVPVPPYADQERIAAFLDTECAKIDALIEQTRSSVEEYRKLKQAIITEAVTKGIRPNRPMKDSGIEWIGEMPTNWVLVPFRHILHERNEKNIPIKSTERLSLSIDQGVTLYAEKTTNLDRFKDDFEQYKLTYPGDLVMNSMNMIVGASGISPYFGCVSPAYYTFYDDTFEHYTAKFCEYIFRSKTMLRVLYSLGKGIYAIVRGDDRVNTCRLKVSREDLRSLQIPLPSSEEQCEIIQYLQKKCAEIDSLIAGKQQLLSELESYKKSLIYEYVTGKKEVS